MSLLSGGALHFTFQSLPKPHRAFGYRPDWTPAYQNQTDDSLFRAIVLVDLAKSTLRYKCVGKLFSSQQNYSQPLIENYFPVTLNPRIRLHVASKIPGNEITQFFRINARLFVHDFLLGVLSVASLSASKSLRNNLV